MKKLIAVILAACLLSGCAISQGNSGEKQYSVTYLNLFDTVTTIVGRGESEAAFQEQAQAVYDELLFYHQLFDIYHDYEGLNNLKTVNDNAGVAPVQVDGAVIRLLLDCKSYYDLTGGKVNVAMGSVLKLWHDARSQGLDDPASATLPDSDALRAAAEHTGLDQVILDEEASTVYLEDPDMRLDVGAIAKGWATQRAAENAPEGLLISVGGNVCATGPKLSDGTAWVVGVRNPDGGESDYLHTISLTTGSVVTSGDYQRAYTVDGILYHHIIDPETLMPSQYWRSVTVLCQDSGLADALSTALFLLPLEEGKALLERCGAEAMWLDGAGNKYFSAGFEENTPV